MKNNKKSIPRPNFNNIQDRIPTPLTQIFANGDNIVFSFKSLVKNEYFNIDITCERWSSELIEMLKNVSVLNKAQLFSGKYGIYRIHSLSSAKIPCKLPDNISKDDMRQIRIAASKGGIHGIFYENIFYVIYLDPLHNMYPDTRYGGLKIIKPPKNCCLDMQEKLHKLTDENNKLKDELEEDNKLLEERTNPTK